MQRAACKNDSALAQLLGYECNSKEAKLHSIPLAVHRADLNTSPRMALASAAHGYDANDRLLEHTYNLNGNTLAATNFNPLANLPAPVADHYDFRNRLVRRDTALGAQPAGIDLAYDGDGNRVRKTVTSGGAALATQYLVDELNPTGWPQVLEELTSGRLLPLLLNLRRSALERGNLGHPAGETPALRRCSATVSRCTPHVRERRAGGGHT